MKIYNSPVLDTEIQRQARQSADSLQTRADVNREGGSQSTPHLDKLFLNTLRPSQATEFLAQHMGKRINENYQLTPALNEQRFGHETSGAAGVVNKIIQLANHAMRKLAPEMGIPAAAYDIRKQIDSGYSDALDIFGVFGQLDEDTQSSIRDVRDLLDRAYQHAPLNGHPDNTSALLFQGERISTSVSTQFEIETADGDRVTISLEQLNEQTNSSVSYGEGLSQVNVRSGENTQSIDVKITVEGDLSDEEKASISKLVGQLTDASDRFDNGESAEEIAASLNLGDELIKNFNFSHFTDQQIENVKGFSESSSTPVQTAEIEPVLPDEYGNIPVNDLQRTVLSILSRITEFREALEKSLEDDQKIFVEQQV
ncbi:MAG: hypothetical protein OEZ43_00185 [Gammaproteobacteria bacterium]|nr:hypothetical protein [Gammaproteobacteria bacterium]